ncbi:hypothetical protein HPB50_014624 [Hyalomma asiaticum]|uniref:Uncharacterized protein n=1 Tax=Hyalomma asiaticum TaxID=266040 RepID=A0ACB7RS53_HYAAI|nr:hypothetical protein HPB50_014624 [Hyalomma asiaticum]
MDVVGVEGEQKVSEDATQDSGWFEVKRRSRKQDGDAAKLKSDSYSTQYEQRIDRDGWKKKIGARNIRQLIAASRMPNLPPEDYRIIIRPRGGINRRDEENQHNSRTSEPKEVDHKDKPVREHSESFPRLPNAQGLERWKSRDRTGSETGPK